MAILLGKEISFVNLPVIHLCNYGGNPTLWTNNLLAFMVELLVTTATAACAGCGYRYGVVTPKEEEAD